MTGKLTCLLALTFLLFRVNQTRLNSPNFLRLSSQVRCSSLLTIFVASSGLISSYGTTERSPAEIAAETQTTQKNTTLMTARVLRVVLHTQNSPRLFEQPLLSSADTSLLFSSSENSTQNGTSPETTVPTSPTPTENSTQNGTSPETTVPTSPTPTENSTQNGTSPETTVPTSPTPTEKCLIYENVLMKLDYCHGDPCGRNLATCISLNSNYTCECKYGFYYSNQNCYRGKAFAATIAVNANYTDSLQDVNSAEYEEMFNKLSQFFREALRNLTGYVETVIVKIQPPSKSRNAVPLNVTVTNLFMWNSTEDKGMVDAAVTHAINNASYVNSYQAAKHCDIYPCDAKTTDCQEGMFPECKCKSGLEKTEGDDRSCSVCSKSCFEGAHKYCVKEEVPRCKCMANFREESGKCVACSVGYSGEECTDNTELILIIVGTVFGAIILSLVIAISIISVRAKNKRNPEMRSLIKSGHSDMNTSDDRPSMFPRVQTTSGHANPGYQPNNPYEMRSKNRDHFPERDYDDMYEISREPRGFRTQSRY
ncbi:mucin-13 [Cinclus cinclus]|uniref:mucin-13 n=1 Tax=Cinclus cinclus TaxID=127875 RepID=UPI002E15BA7A